MKYVKMLGLLAVAAAALMAFAGIASATTVTNGSTQPASTIVAKAESTLTLKGDNVTVTCTESTVEGSVTTNGAKDKTGKTLNASGPITGLTFTGCNHHVEDPVKTRGTLSVDSSGTLFSTGAQVTITATTFLGSIHCAYVTNNTHIGTVTEPANHTGHATLDIQSAAIQVDPTKSSGLCGSTATWNGNYTVTSPVGMTID